MASTRKTKSGRHQLDLYDELHEFLDEVNENVWESKEKALDEAADYFVQKLEQETPVGDTGKLRESWERTDKYKNVRYVYNTDATQKGIPVANLVEFSKNGKPFIRPCFEKNKEKIIDIIIKGVKTQ